MPELLGYQFDRTVALPIERYRQVATTAERDAIPTGKRWHGMLCYVTSDQADYQLIGGITNLDWKVAGVGNYFDLTGNDSDDITEGVVNLFLSTTDQAKLDFITITQAVDLDALETAVAALGSGVNFKGGWDASVGTFPGGGTAAVGDLYVTTTAGTVDGVSFALGDGVIAIVINASTTVYAANWVKTESQSDVTSVVGLTGAISKAALLAALNVEDGATADMTGSEISTAITTFLGNSDWQLQLTTEQVQDIMGGLIAAGVQTNITVTYNDSTGSIDYTVAPFIEIYATLAALISGQGSQDDDKLYEVTDASGFTGITSGTAWVRYLGTTLGTEADYIIVSAAQDAVVPAPIPLSPYADDTALFAGQANQLTNYIYEVTDGSGFTGVTSGAVWVKYLGTTVGDETDYIIISKAEGFGGGDVSGPASATDNALARFDTTTGKLLQDSVVTASDTGAVAGVTTLDLNQVRPSKGANVASATALEILTDGNSFNVTGTTTITSINTTGKVGTVIKLRFDAILILTHHATDLILPTGANITTQAGDEVEFLEYAAGDFRCTSYLRADGTALVGGSGTNVTTKGDLQTFSTVGARLPVGVDDQELTPDSGETTGLKWQYKPIVYNVKNYGALGDGIDLADGDITASDATFTSASATFTANDVGKVIGVSGAGTGGNYLITTIASFTNANEVELTATAGTTVSGAIFFYGTDDTSEIQDTIDAAFTAGGGVVFIPNGIYILNGALQNNIGTELIDYNSQLYIPYHIYQSNTRPTIKISGETPPMMYQSNGIGNAKPTNKGVVLRSTIIGSGTKPSVLASNGDPGAPLSTMNYTGVVVENLQIQLTPVETSNKISVGGINFSQSAQCDVQNITVFPYNIWLGNTIQPTIEMSGIELPSWNCEHFGNLENCEVGGLYHGFVAGEHSYMNNATAVACFNAFSQNTNGEPAIYNKISAYWCVNSFNVISTSIKCRFNIFSLDIEWDSQGKWYDNINSVIDSNNYGVGKIGLHIVQADGGIRNDLHQKIGGKEIKIDFIEPGDTNGQTGTYTFEILDAHRMNHFSNVSAISATVPPSSTSNFDINDSIDFYQSGVGQLTIVAGAGVTIVSAETLKLRKQYSAASLIKIDTDSWLLTGDLEIL